MSGKQSLIWGSLIFCALGACAPKEETGPVDENIATDADTTEVDTAAADEAMVEFDGVIPDEGPESAIPDETIDAMLPDETSDTAMPDTAASDADAIVPEGAYQQCDPAVPNACPEPMACVKGYDNAQYGQCLIACNENKDCPPPPDPTTMQVACHEQEKVCLILCGAYQSECPAWLECFGQQMCLPPSSVTATKGPGEICAGKDECVGDSDCIEGSSGIPHCYPLCDPNVPNDCANKAPGYQAQCQNAGGFSFCMFTCQGGVPCPGDLTCVAGVFCQG